MLPSSPEILWEFAIKSERIFLRDSENIKNPIVCYQCILVACALTVLLVREKRGIAASTKLEEYFTEKIDEYVLDSSDLNDMPFDYENGSQFQLEAFIKVLEPGTSIRHLQMLANNLYSEPGATQDLIEQFRNFNMFSIATGTYRKLILQNCAI